jgi:hypothetical protein
MLVVAPLIAEKNPPPAVADNARPLAEQHAASTYSDTLGIHQGATGANFAETASHTTCECDERRSSLVSEKILR